MIATAAASPRWRAHLPVPRLVLLDSARAATPSPPRLPRRSSRTWLAPRRAGDAGRCRPWSSAWRNRGPAHPRPAASRRRQRGTRSPPSGARRRSRTPAPPRSARARSRPAAAVDQDAGGDGTPPTPGSRAATSWSRGLPHAGGGWPYRRSNRQRRTRRRQRATPAHPTARHRLPILLDTSVRMSNRPSIDCR